VQKKQKYEDLSKKFKKALYQLQRALGCQLATLIKQILDKASVAPARKDLNMLYRKSEDTVRANYQDKIRQLGKKAYIEELKNTLAEELDAYAIAALENFIKDYPIKYSQDKAHAKFFLLKLHDLVRHFKANLKTSNDAKHIKKIESLTSDLGMSEVYSSWPLQWNEGKMSWVRRMKDWFSDLPDTEKKNLQFFQDNITRAYKKINRGKLKELCDQLQPWLNQANSAVISDVNFTCTDFSSQFSVRTSAKLTSHCRPAHGLSLGENKEQWDKLSLEQFMAALAPVRATALDTKKKPFMQNKDVSIYYKLAVALAYQKIKENNHLVEPTLADMEECLQIHEGYRNQPLSKLLQDWEQAQNIYESAGFFNDQVATWVKETLVIPLKDFGSYLSLAEIMNINTLCTHIKNKRTNKRIINGLYAPMQKENTNKLPLLEPNIRLVPETDDYSFFNPQKRKVNPANPNGLSGSFWNVEQPWKKPCQTPRTILKADVNEPSAKQSKR
jgi:hypothetical protein